MHSQGPTEPPSRARWAHSKSPCRLLGFGLRPPSPLLPKHPRPPSPSTSRATLPPPRKSARRPQWEASSSTHQPWGSLLPPAGPSGSSRAARHLAPAGAGRDQAGRGASPAPLRAGHRLCTPRRCQRDSALLAAHRRRGPAGGRGGVRTGGLWGGHPLPRPRAPLCPHRGRAWGQRASARPATPGSSPTGTRRGGSRGGGGGGEEARE